MVRTNWERIFSLNVSSLTDEEIEDLCPTIMRCNVDEISDINNLQTLMKISQEMLQYKDNQVESLLIECGELKNTISTLKPDVSAKRKREGQIVSDSQYEDESFVKPPEAMDAANRETAIQEKNEKIEKLLIELEGLDRENIILKERLGMLKEEMEDATERMNEMTDELSSAQSKVLEYKERILDLERENIALLNQIEELTSQQMNRDKVIDEFGVAIDSRIAEWKELLDEKDAEIQHLRENLSRSLMQSVTSVKEENKSQIVHLNDEIDNRDKIIKELQSKLAEAVREINDGAAMIEKLQASAKRPEKEERRREQKELLKKIQDASDQISDLQSALGQTQEDLKLKSTELCEVLSTLKKYEDGNQGLTEALHEIKDLKNQLNHKREHIEDLVNVVNKLEMLNSYKEMEILTLREKLGMSEDESISIDNILKKRKEEEKRMEELVRQNKILIDENIEMKSTIRLLKSNGSRVPTKKLDFSRDTIDNDNSTDFLHSTKLLETAANRLIDFESIEIYRKTDDDVREEMRLVVEENEALRRGMHEILDSIRSQDGKSSVEVHSYTLERLLEALDVRHLAGWYHPAMRLQEHLNVIQGSNAELRSQIKQIRKELNRKDALLRDLASSKGVDLDRLLNVDDPDDEKSSSVTEMKNILDRNRRELEELGRERESLIEENKELRLAIADMNLRVDVYEKERVTLETGEDEVKRSYAIKTREYIESIEELSSSKRKIVLLEELLNRESVRAYDKEKTMIEKESSLRRELIEGDKRNKMLEREMTRLQSNLSNSTSKIEYEDLKEKYVELNVRYRSILERDGVTTEFIDRPEIESLREELSMTRKEKSQLIDLMNEDLTKFNENDCVRLLRDSKVKELTERQRADHMTKLHEISQGQFVRAESKVKEMTDINHELRERLIDVHKELSRLIASTRVVGVGGGEGVRGGGGGGGGGGGEEQRDETTDRSNDAEIENLRIDNETLKRKLAIAVEEAGLQYALNSSNTLELDNLRHQILDLQAISEDKATISRLSFELAGKKSNEMELNARKSQLESELSYLKGERERLTNDCDKLRAGMIYCRKQCDDRCRIYVDVIDFLQSQYAGSSSISALDRLTSAIERYKCERLELDAEMKRTKEFNNRLIAQQETLTNRLEIVERLKDILEEQIGGENVQDILQKYSENSQYVLNDLKQKRRITHLDNELQMVNDKATKYESIITTMENEMINMQRTWCRRDERPLARTDVKINEMKFDDLEKRSVFVQVTTEFNSTGIQTEPYDCCLYERGEKKGEDKLDKREEKEEKKEEDKVEEKAEEEKEVEVEVGIADKPIEEGKSVREAGNNTDTTNDTITMIRLNERLSDALKDLADRNEIIKNYESDISEYRDKVKELNRRLENMESELLSSNNVETMNVLVPSNFQAITTMDGSKTDCSERLALRSTVNSLQRIVAQKEETIARYQNLMREEREEYVGITCNLQKEINDLRCEVKSLEDERVRGVRRSRRRRGASDERNNVITNFPEIDEGKNDEYDEDEDEDEDEVEVENKNEETKKSFVVVRNAAREEEIARTAEIINTLEADLHITKELSDRWHRLAEERLKHIDRMRERGKRRIVRNLNLNSCDLRATTQNALEQLRVWVASGFANGDLIQKQKIKEIPSILRSLGNNNNNDDNNR